MLYDYKCYATSIEKLETEAIFSFFLKLLWDAELRDSNLIC